MADDDEPMAEAEERVTAQSYGALDTSRVSEECWMIKIPHKLADLWDRAPEGADLGELIFTKGGTDATTKAKIKPSLMVRVSEEFAAQQQTTIPLNYSLQAMTKKVPLMHPFVRNPKNGTVSLLGTVSRTANAQVEQDNKYRALLKDRLVATNITSSRFVKPVEVSESVIAKQRSKAAAMAGSSSSTGRKGFGDAVFQVGKRMLEATQEGLQQQQQQQEEMEQGRSKKARQFEPDQPIRSVVFELFGQQQYWSLKGLKSAAVAGGATNAGTKKAETEIKSVLREIAEYHRSGDHKSMWELRKEFQKQT